MKAIRNNEARLIQIQIAGDVMLNLKPGENLVDEAQWAKAKQIKVVRNMLDEETLTEPKGTIKADTAVEALAELSPARAAKLVGDTYDLALLNEWAKVEKRKPVTDAIASQIEIINAAGNADQGKSKE